MIRIIMIQMYIFIVLDYFESTFKEQRDKGRNIKNTEAMQRR